MVRVGLTDPRKAAALLAWVLVFSYSWAPFEFSFHSFRAFDPLDEAGWPGLGFHFLAFALVGFLSRAGSGATARRVIPSVITRDLSFCVLVELGQIFAQDRHPEIHDLFVNAVGVFSGHAILPIVGHPWTRTFLTATRNRNRVLTRSGLFFCCIFWVTALMLPLRKVSLADWDVSYPLLLGNERDGDRAWEGEVKYLAVYDRSLSASDVGNLSDLLPPASEPASARTAIGAIAVYDFAQAPFVLEPHSEITSLAPGEPLTRRIASQGSFSVEVWLKPADLTLTGPARIIGISESAWRRNFSLAQEGRSIYFRVRNPLNGVNGINHEYRCENVLAEAFSHIVVTYERGAISLYKDGRQHCPTLDMREPSLLLGLGGNRVSNVVAALLCAVTFLLSGASLAGVLIAGYGALAVPLVIGVATGSPPAPSLYYWFGPLATASGYMLLVRDYSRH